MRYFLFVLFFFLSIMICNNGFGQNIGLFTYENDVGKVLHKGAVQYDDQTEDYFLSGSGSNIWFSNDEFYFLSRKIKGDFILQARIKFLGSGVDPHRKIGLMARKSLSPNSASVNATVHGDGLTSLQSRKIDNALVEEVKFDSSANVIELERKGNQYCMSAALQGQTYNTQTKTVELGEEIYLGLFICSHNKDVVEKVVFDNVRLIIPASGDFVPYKDYLGSNIEVYNLATGKRKTIYSSQSSLQAPNWHPSGRSLIYNRNGQIYKFDFANKSHTLINTRWVKDNNNDHVISFDGKMLGLSSPSRDNKYNSVVFTVPFNGGAPKQITPIGPSYLHGWSPNGKELVYTAERNKEFDIYKILSKGGKEIRLTKALGLDDGPEYSPDSKYIYFNSVRSGTMQIWKMKTDGTEQIQITNDEFNNWFPHVSPDGKSVVFLSFMKDVSPEDHPFYKHVYLRMMPIKGGTPKVVVYLYGGQGSINTSSWAPDSKFFAFISNSDLINDK